MSDQTALAIDNIYQETEKFLILGLTGRTGSGCTTAADKLASGFFDIPAEGYNGLTVNELKKHRIIKKYTDVGSWVPFHRVEVSSIITFHLFLLTPDELGRYLGSVIEDKAAVSQIVENFFKNYADIGRKVVERFEHEYDLRYGDISVWHDLYFKDLPAVTKYLRDALGRSDFTDLYQKTGDNVRSSHSAIDSIFNPHQIFSFPKHINFIIKIAHEISKSNDMPCRVVIDAIRNPYEAFYLKRRYANFYLVSINTPDIQRLLSLRTYRGLSDEQIRVLDKKEYPTKLAGPEKFIAQNIQECIEISDIHIHNSKASEFTHNDLVSQLAWYVTLMVHPGLVMPTSLENCMQMAYSAKQSSGCISRQVGAVVTDDSYSIKAVGWNSTPQGQTPCLLRSAEDLLSGVNSEDYSYYELTNKKFQGALAFKYQGLIASTKASGRNIAFCFKSIQNEIEGEKNQVHTRSLHAEENAFLQISKYGGQKLLGGVLFTTASPCELCAKKAYQLGIKKIVYIDPYPGIATDHILSVGANRPELELFRGAVGRAFYQLYQPLMPYKDELELIFDIPKYQNPERKTRSVLEKENIQLKIDIDLLKGELEMIKAEVRSQP